MDAHSHSVLDRSLNWICDFRSIFEVFTTLPIAIISPANCFMTIEEEPRRRDGSFEPRLDRSCSFCLIWTFSAFVGYLRIGRRGDVFGWKTPDPGYIRLRRRVWRGFLQLGHELQDFYGESEWIIGKMLDLEEQEKCMVPGKLWEDWLLNLILV